MGRVFGEKDGDNEKNDAVEVVNDAVGAVNDAEGVGCRGSTAAEGSLR